MSTVKTSLPEGLQAFVDEPVFQRGRDEDRLRFRGLLLEGASSAATKRAGPAYFAKLRRSASRRTS